METIGVLIGPSTKLRLQDMDRIDWSIDIEFDDEKDSGVVQKRTGTTTLTGKRFRSGKWILSPIAIRILWTFDFDLSERRYRLTAEVDSSSSHDIIDPAGNILKYLDAQSLIGLRNAIRKNPVAAPKTGQLTRRRLDMTSLPKFIKVNGERYRLAAAEEITAARKKKRRGKRPNKGAPAIKADDRFDDQFYKGDAVEFDIVILTKSRTGEELPAGSKKVGRSIPEDIDSKLTPAQKVEAEKAKEKGELWYYSVSQVGWHWRDKNPTGAVDSVQKALDYIDRQKQKALDYIDRQKGSKSPSVIYSSRLIKAIGFSSR